MRMNGSASWDVEPVHTHTPEWQQSEGSLHDNWHVKQRQHLTCSSLLGPDTRADPRDAQHSAWEGSMHGCGPTAF